MHLRRGRYGGRAHRIGIGRERHRHAQLAEQLDRRLLRLVQGEVRARQQGRHRARLRHRPHRRPRGEFQVIGRQAAILGDDGAGAEIGVLVGVQLDGQAKGPRLVEQAAHLRVAEAHLVAKAVDLVDQALAHGLGQDVVAHEVDVVVTPAGIFGGEAMGAEIGRHDGDRQVAAQARARSASGGARCRGRGRRPTCFRPW